jgi:hypothetical protein
MAFVFIPETGDGIEDANAYIEPSFARDYHEGRGALATWNGADVLTSITGATFAADTLAVVDHPFITGDGPVRLTGADLPAPLVIDTDYWVVVVDSATLKLATSLADAIATVPVVVNLADDGSGTRTIVHPSFLLQRQAIVRATDYIEGLYGDRFIGYRASDEQGLAWPRDGAFLNWVEIEGVPLLLQKAVAEFALDALAGSLTSSDSSASVIEESKTAGRVTKTVKYAEAQTSTDYVAAERFLRALLLPTMAVRA